MRFPFFRNHDSVKNGILISIRRTGDGFHPGLFSKSSRSITEQILQHPGEKFNVAPFVHGRCKAPIEEIKLLLMVLFQKNKRLNSDSALITLMN